MVVALPRVRNVKELMTPRLSPTEATVASRNKINWIYFSFLVVNLIFTKTDE